MTHPLVFHTLPRPLRAVLDAVTGLGRCRRWYDRRPRDPAVDPSLGLIRYTLRRLGLRIDVDQRELLDEIPRTGPLLAVANHPLGALEGMVLTELLAQVRGDVRVVTNRLLCRLPEFHDRFIGVDVLADGPQASNASGLRTAARHLGGGGALLMFPAGTVGDLDLRRRRVHDRRWNNLVGRLALRTGAVSVPFHVDGRNDWWFYLSAWIHRRLRTALLPRALLGQRGGRVRITCGRPITGLAGFDATAYTETLRLSCELLGEPAVPAPARTADTTPTAEQDAADRHLIDGDTSPVHSQGAFAVYILPYDRLGPVAGVLAQERERTFRLAGEGTGQPVDRDCFDPAYNHILVWDHDARRLVGGYRAAVADAVLAQRDSPGLYSQSLFRYRRDFLTGIGPAIEVGRSFVTPAYQGSTAALDLLWHGIGRMMLMHPHCHTLFGCVSIAGTYAPLVRSLLADTCLAAHALEDRLRSRVQPVARWRAPRRCWSPALIEALGSVGAVNKLLGQIDPRARVPVLIRHYLALGGRFVDFSLNRGFNDALDGLIVVDLRDSAPRYLRRYLGAEGADAFRRRWEVADAR